MKPPSRKAMVLTLLLSAFPALALAQALVIEATPQPGHPLSARIMTWLLAAIVFLLIIFATRHYVFTVARLFGRQRQPYLDVEMGNWPDVVIFIAAHNEEQVIADSLTALLAVDYPHEKLIIMPVNDRSSDKTRMIIDRIAAANPGRLHPFHRTEGRPGKAAALKDATAMIDVEVIVIFDADYLPARGLIKQLVAPLIDPEVGAVMGRVVPLNVGQNLLTRLLDLERAGGYQVDQAARMNLGLVPQYGGTVGAVRQRALNEIGGWDIDMLAEDTDITFRLLQNGWKTVYQNRSECYEEVPETWRMRIGQISRWSRGHNQVLMKNIVKLVLNTELRFWERLDGALLLGVFMMSPILILGWMLATALFFISPQYWVLGWLAFFALLSYSALGTNAAFFEIAAATYLDGNRNRIRLLPLSMLGFLISMVTISKAALIQLFDYLRSKELTWHKTERFRRVTIETSAFDVDTVALKPPSDTDAASAPQARKP